MFIVHVDESHIAVEDGGKIHGFMESLFNSSMLAKSPFRRYTDSTGVYDDDEEENNGGGTILRCSQCINNRKEHEDENEGENEENERGYRYMCKWLSTT